MNARAAAILTFVVLALTDGMAAGGRPGDEAAVTPGDSVYQLAGAFRDQTGHGARVDVYRGSPVLMSMFYASCTDTCPLLITELRRIEESLPSALRADVRVVLVSLDPARDTPAALQRLAKTHGLDADRWRLLTGTDDSARDVAAVLGMKLRRLTTGGIDHSTVIAVLDRRGVVESRMVGIAPGDPGLIVRVTQALKRAARPVE